MTTDGDDIVVLAYVTYSMTAFVVLGFIWSLHQKYYFLWWCACRLCDGFGYWSYRLGNFFLVFIRLILWCAKSILFFYCAICVACGQYVLGVIRTGAILFMEFLFPFNFTDIMLSLCPTYFLGQSWHFVWYVPLRICLFCVVVCGCSNLHVTFIVLSDMPKLLLWYSLLMVWFLEPWSDCPVSFTLLFLSFFPTSLMLR
jgi:hypothetical protein